nr:HTTM domain-containing protein [Kofleriaceae bacterium]
MTAVARWWLRDDAPAERLALLRIVIGAWACVYTLARVPELYALSQHPAGEYAPVGAARLFASPLAGVLAVALGFATAALLAAFALGVAWRAVAPIAALALLWMTSYRNSWGMVFHTEDLLVLHVVALAVTPAADAWAIGARRRARGEAGYGWAVRLLGALTAATYLLAGIAKLRLAGASWLDGDLLRDQIAIDNLRKALMGDDVAVLSGVMLDHAWLLAGLAAGSLAVELGAPAALLGGRVARVWVAAAWAFHLGVVLAMNIWFPYPLLGPAFLPLLRPESWPARAREWRRGRAG